MNLRSAETIAANSSYNTPRHKHNDSHRGDTALELQQVNAGYGSKTVLHDISARISSGGITSIIGPSGCGKSTLLKCLNGMLQEDAGGRMEGRILLHGENTASIRAEDLRRRIGFVSQTPTPFPMSIYRNMTYALTYFGRYSKVELDQRVIDKLTITGLYDEVKDQLHTSALALSGGQQQRLCIARALTVEPEILLLDEPCSALDVQSTRTIETLLKQLKETYTILIVTHNLAQAKRLSDQILFLYDGRLVEQAAGEYLFSNPQSQQLKDFLAAE